MERTRNDNKNKKRAGKQEGKVTIGFSFASDLSKLSRPIKEGSQPKFMRSRITLNILLKITYLSALQRLIYWRAITFKVHISNSKSYIPRGSFQVKCIVLRFIPQE